MKTTFLTIILLVSFSCQSQPKASKEINVLFIGNSLTYFHDMPQTLQKMLNETDPNIKIHQSTFPGMSLDAHLTDIIESRTENGISTRKKNPGEITETEKKIQERKWDVIVLQTGQVSVLIPESRELMIGKAIENIKKLSTNPDCEFILFYTWASKETFPTRYCYFARDIDPTTIKKEFCSPLINSLKHELDLINEAHDLLAQRYNLTKTDNGNKFYEVLTQHPEMNLYEDESHPNQYGAFSNACIFYRMLTKKKPSALRFTGDLEPSLVKSLKQIAD